MASSVCSESGKSWQKTGLCGKTIGLGFFVLVLHHFSSFLQFKIKFPLLQHSYRKLMMYKLIPLFSSSTVSFEFLNGKRGLTWL